MILTSAHNSDQIPPYSQNGGACMKGNIYTAEKCPLCRDKIRYSEDRNGFICSKHPEQIVIPRKCFVRFGRSVMKRFNNLIEAQQFLNKLRYETGKEIFDVREYKSGHLLGFETQALKWLNIKKKKLKPDTYSRMEGSLNRMIEYWRQKNIKTFSMGDFEDYLYDKLDVSNKTRSNVRSYMNDLFTWLSDREEIPMPKIPKVHFEKGSRDIMGIDDQTRVINEVKKICPHFRVWLGIKWLATYVSIRPKELRFLKEKEIDMNGFFMIPHPKEKIPKLVPMIEDDIKLYRSLPTGMPDLYFFRHDKSNGSAKPGDHYSKNMFYTWWKRACKNIGIEDIDLYGGTRHSTINAMGKYFTKEQLKEDGTLHRTLAAFDHYFTDKRDDSIKIFEKIREVQETCLNDNNVINIKG
jgi:integrase